MDKTLLFDVFAGLVSSLLLELPPPLFPDEPNENMMSEILCVFLSSEKAVVLLYLHIFYRQRFTHLNLYITPSEYYLRYDIAFHRLSCLLTEFIFFFPRPTR